MINDVSKIDIIWVRLSYLSSLKHQIFLQTNLSSRNRTPIYPNAYNIFKTYARELMQKCSTLSSDKWTRKTTATYS